jgi:hypothetical protein
MNNLEKYDNNTLLLAVEGLWRGENVTRKDAMIAFALMRELQRRDIKIRP